MRRPNPNVLGWSFIGPAFVHLLAFALIPMGYAFYVSLHKINLFTGESQSVGMRNYAGAIGEQSFLDALINSFRYAILSVPMGMIVALAIAILVNQKLRGMAFFRTLFYIPAIASGIATSMLWIYVFLPDTGLINTMLRPLGDPNGGLPHTIYVGIMSGVDAIRHLFGATDNLAGQPINIAFLSDKKWAMFALAFMSVWVGLGPRMVLFLAGLIGIPAPLYEAASLDGASPWRQFWSITLPQLMPTTLFVLVTSTIGAMQIFTPIYLMTQGGPEGSTDVVGYHIYTEAWVNFNTSLASAKSFILLAIIAVISFVQLKFIKTDTE